MEAEAVAAIEATEAAHKELETVNGAACNG